MNKRAARTKKKQKTKKHLFKGKPPLAVAQRSREVTLGGGEIH